MNEDMIAGLKDFPSMSLQYQGDNMPFSLIFGKQYERLNNCAGWCRLPKARRVAICVMCDKSNEFGVAIRNNEEGEGVQSAPIPIERSRSVVYLEESMHLKAIENLLVACCYEIGSYLIEIRRRQLENRITDGEWRTTWDDLKKCNGRAIKNMCNPQPMRDRGLECPRCGGTASSTTKSKSLQESSRQLTASCCRHWTLGVRFRIWTGLDNGP